eukprot:339853_1
MSTVDLNSTLSTKQLLSLTKPVLIKLCKKYNVPTYGSKKDIIERINKAAAVKNQPSSSRKHKKNQRSINKMKRKPRKQKSRNDIFIKKQNKNQNSESRLIDIMYQHHKLFNNDVNNQNITRTQFFKSFHESYGFVFFLDDFNTHLDHEHKDPSYLEEIYYKLINYNKKSNKCDASKCAIIARHARDKIRCKNNKFRVMLYGGHGITDKEIAHHQLIDNVHVHLYHTFDMGLKLFKSDHQNIQHNDTDDVKYSSNDQHELSKVIQEKVKKYKKLRDKYHKNESYNEYSISTNKKFIKIMKRDDVCETFRDSLIEFIMEEIKFDKLTCKLFEQLEELLVQHEYDSDAIFADIKTNTRQSNVAKLINNRRYYYDIRKYVKENDPSFGIPLFSFGYRYYYWHFFKDNDNEFNKICRKTEGSNDGTFLYDYGNTGYKAMQWYITQKYDNIKQEIVNGNNDLDISQWTTTLNKAEYRLEVQMFKNMKANRFWKHAYGIKKGTSISLHHIISVLLYCNYSDLCYKFSMTYRKATKYESNKSVRNRHTNYWNMGKYLRESVEVFGNRRILVGTKFSETDIKYFYHGISTDMLFNNCHAKIAGPTSTTISEEVSTIFATEAGIVLKLWNDKSLNFFGDCKNISDYVNENEKLLIGGFSEILFDTIIRLCNIEKHYGPTVSIINTINNMILSNSNAYEFPYPVYKNAAQKLKRLIQYETNELKIDNKEDDIYEVNLFKNFCANVENAKFNMAFMKSHFLYEHTIRKIPMYGFQNLYPIFFDVELDMVNLSFMFKLFKNIKQIIIEKWEIQQYELPADLCEKMMYFIFSSLSNYVPETFETLKISSKTSIHEQNDICPASHKLSLFETECDDYSCDRCDSTFPKKTKMYGCFNEETICDYCVCNGCFVMENKAVIYLKQAVDKYQSKFHNILWDIKLRKHLNEAKEISDAICFEKLFLKKSIGR